MPYTVDGTCVKRKDTGETVKCHDTHEEAVKHLQALQANVKDSAVVEMPMRITKASYNKSEPNAMKWVAIDSDTDDDLYQEKMSMELYNDFVSRIENKTPIPEEFSEIICESDWCGGMPYLSIAHYKAGTGKTNVPGDVESIFIDGTRLKSKGILHNNSLGRAVWEKLREDMYIKEKSTNPDHKPVRISIGFLDLEHKHQAQNGGQEFTFVRKSVGEICPLCAQGIGGKIYTKGQLVHLAMTRVPVNPRTEMSVELSMDEIKSKRDDAESIIGKDLVNELEEKSLTDDVLVVRADVGSAPTPANMELCDECYDPNTDSYDQACVDSVMEKYVGQPRADATVKSKARFDAVSKSLGKLYKLDGQEKPIVEESMASLDATVTGLNTSTVNPDVVTDKSVLGIPEKPFTYAGLDGNGNNNIPNPVKAKKDEEAGENDKAGDEESEMEKSFMALRKRVMEAKSKNQSGEAVQDINQLFAELGQAVEKEFAPKPVTTNGIDANALAEIIRSAVAPLQLQIAQLESKIGKGNTVSTEQVVKSRALTLSGYPTEETLKSIPQQLQRKLSKIEEIAYRSTGAIR